ncbi:MAG: phosphatidylglycerophosphatase A [Candidatus Zixiibacteriota bacterium]
MKQAVVKLCATGLYSGYFPFAAGTVGTVPAWLIAFYLISDNPLLMASAASIAFVVSVWAATEAELLFGHDSKMIVSDEWAGMFVSLVLVPFSLSNFLIAFVMFRLFDVIKLPPASQAERLPRGWGVTMDDMVAGVQANVATQLIILVMNQFSQQPVGG